jgi:hypothetical protein
VADTDGPAATRDGGSRRKIALIAGGAGIVLVITAIAALAFRTDDTKPAAHVVTQSPSTDVPASVPASAPTSTRPRVTTTTQTAAPATTATIAAPTTTVAAKSNTNTPIATAPTTAAPHAVPPSHGATPPASPISVLQWSGPTSVTVATNGKKPVSVGAHNPSAGIVSLPHPLSCAPTLQHDEVCPEMVQMIASGATARASFVVDATNVEPGVYTLSIEGVRNITVTVTK